MGRAEDGTFVPRTLPGEVISLSDDGTPRILEPSPDRVSAPCRHFKSCGGCAMQHASDAFVADWKQEVVRRALAAHGLAATFRPPHASPAQSRRRAKFSGRRTKKGAQVGFHARASHQIIDVPDCMIVTPAIRAALPMLQELTQLAASRKTEIGVTVTDSVTGLDISLSGALPLTDALRLTLAQFVAAHGLARLTWNDETVVTREMPVQEIDNIRVVPPPGAFLQATKAGEGALLHAVAEIVGGSARIVDLFAGCGTFALPLARTAEVHAVEGDAMLLASLDRAWRHATGLKRVTHEERDLFRRPLEPDELKRFDCAVIDPPRAGAEAQVEAICRSHLARIAMVSCNPTSFARDAARLSAAGFACEWLQVIDQFRWSTHVELVACFTRS